MRATIVTVVFVAGCSGGTTTERGAVLYRPCAAGTEVGSFHIWTGSSAGVGWSTFFGAVFDQKVVFDHWRPLVSHGDCTLMVPDPATPCAEECTGPNVCQWDGRCGPSPVSGDAGTVELSGLLDGARTFQPYGSPNLSYGSNPGELPYPPAAPGGVITLRAAGRAYAPFTLEGRGFTPLPDLSGTQVTVTRGQPLGLAWEPPATPVTTRLLATLYLAGDNGRYDGTFIPGAGRITCDFQDEGTGVLPAALIDTLIDQGVNTTSGLYLRRMTVSSTQLAHGCVDFSVSAEAWQTVVVTEARQ